MSHSTVMGAADIQRALTRIAHEILERNSGAENVVLMGIPTRGVPLAQRIAQKLHDIDSLFSPTSNLGVLDITMYRDDLHQPPTRTIAATVAPEAGIDGKTVILIDDVFHTGRTIRAALDALNDLGRPQQV